MKKKRTPEQQIRRGKFALSMLFVMSIVCILGGLVNKCDTEKVLSVADIMDTKLDSLLLENNYQGYEIIKKEQVSLCSYIPSCSEEDSLMILTFKLSLDNITENEKVTINEQIKRLKVTIDEYKKDKRNMLIYHNRRIRFKDRDGKIFTCIQTMDTNLISTKLKHVICLEEIDFTQDELFQQLKDIKN